jgi:hypothetical protein
VRMIFCESLKFAVLAELVLSPLPTLKLLAAGCLISATLPAIVHQIRRGGWFGWCWALPYAGFWLVALSWIPLWGMFTAPRSGWLTRGLPNVRSPAMQPRILPNPR